MRSWSVPLCLWLALVWFACSRGADLSNLVFACANNSDCVSGQSCINGICGGAFPGDAACPCDAGDADSGVGDGGPATDAGTADAGDADSGANQPDGGPITDAGADAGGVDAGNPCVPNIPCDNLAGFWRMDDGSGFTAIDASGKGDNGTITGAASWIPGVLGSAISFAADAGKVSCGTASSLNFGGPFTISFWIATSGLNSMYQQNFVSKGSWPIAGWEVIDDGANGPQILFKVYPSRSQVPFPRSLINDGGWHHVGGVYDGVSISIYADGVLQRALGVDAGEYDAGLVYPFLLRAYGTSAAMALDQTRFYSRALTATEMQALAGEPDGG